MSSTQIKIKWKEAEDRHCQGITTFGSVWIRLDKKDKVTAMYTMFGSTHKYMPDEDWMLSLEGAQLKLEEIVYREKNTRDWGESLRSKTNLHKK